MGHFFLDMQYMDLKQILLINTFLSVNAKRNVKFHQTFQNPKSLFKKAQREICILSTDVGKHCYLSIYWAYQTDKQ